MKPEYLFFVALVGYSCAIVSHVVLGKIAKWMMMVFGFSLALDIESTIAVCVQSYGVTLSLHTIFGFLALAIMLGHFIWYVYVVCRSHSNKSEVFLRKYTFFAWIIWVLAFVSGIPISFRAQILIFIAVCVTAFSVAGVWALFRDRDSLDARIGL